MILQFPNDSRVTHNPSYAEMVSTTKLDSLRTLKQMFSTLLENKTLPAKDRAYYQKQYREMCASISEIQRNAA